MSRYATFLILVFVLAVGSGLGCYTVLRHPAADFSFSEPGDKTCADCHSDSDAYHWRDPYYTSFYSQYPSTWGTYYLNPWWYDRPWYGDPGPWTPPAESGGRHAWDRGPGSPEVPSVGGTQVGTVPSASGKPTGTVTDTTRTRTPERTRDRDKDEPKRNAWGR